MLPKTTAGQRSKGVRKTNGMTLIHRLQRSWPMVRTAQPISELSNQTKVVSQLPATRQHDLQVTVELQSVKQGKYKSGPATLLMFEVSLDRWGAFPEVCLEIRIETLPDGPRSGSPSYIGAYGPRRVTEWPEPIGPARQTAKDLPATVEMRPTGPGAILIVRPRDSNPWLAPSVFPFGIVAVHTEKARIKVLPSCTDPARLKARSRTIVKPINLDLDDKLGEPIISCAHQGEGGCHSTCDDFGQEHMTPGIWAQNLTTFNLMHYDGRSPTTVSRLMDPELAYQLTTRLGPATFDDTVMHPLTLPFLQAPPTHVVRAIPSSSSPPFCTL